jgi:hypothetical protein
VNFNEEYRELTKVMDLAADLRAYVAGRRDSKQEQALLCRIRALPKSQRMEVLAPLLSLNWWVALVLADRAQLLGGDYSAILRRGLAEADASSIKFWMKATLAHLGWRRVISVLREALTTNPRGAAFALYHVPYFFSSNAPNRELQVELLQLIVLYHENGHTVVPPSDFDRIKSTLWDLNYQSHDDANSVLVEFALSWEDWVDSRQIQKADAKTLKQYKADYLRFGAERRLFSANVYGWQYTNSIGIARHDWSELVGVAYQTRVIVLMAKGSHYPLPRSAFNKTELGSLMQWLELAMKQNP